MRHLIRLSTVIAAMATALLGAPWCWPTQQRRGRVQITPSSSRPTTRGQLDRRLLSER